MAAREVIVASVRDFLAEIQQMSLEKAGLEAVNPTKATYLQSQIWRKFTIIQCLMDFCPKAKELLKEEFIRSRKELKAEAKDLRLMSVPKAVDAKMVQGWLDAEEVWREGPFEYLRLPPEVRQVILGFLDCPNDQLTLGEVLPADGHMMKWDENALRFEKVLSILMAREMLTYGDIKSLILTGDYMQIAASNWFEAYLKESFTIVYTTHYQSAGGLRDLEEEVTTDEFTVNPIPACIGIYFLPDEYEEDEDLDLRKENQLRILHEMGHNIWDCHIVIDGMTIIESMTRIKDCLTLMPNVKFVRLELFDFSDYPNPDADDITYFNDVELPDLPNLRGLKLGWIRCDAFAIKVLRKYGNCLTHLQTEHLPLVPPEDAILFPNLTVLDLHASLDVNYTAEPMFEIARLEALAGSALKVIHFDIYRRNQRRIPEYFRSLLCCLNQFGGTLEELYLAFPDEYVSDSGMVGDLSWLGNIEFPKVKKMTVSCHPDTWNFLLHFPALETLCWNYRPGIWEKSFAPSNYFNFSWRKREMCSSSLWKMLPFLKSIEFRPFGICKVIRTRSESLAYQQKYGQPKRKSKAERRQENADWGTRKSARIAKMQQQ